MATHQITPPAGSPCPECGTARIPADAISYGYIRVVRPGALIPGASRAYSNCAALVCPQCGHTTLYAKDPAKLQES
ncbi:MAG TPA: hypothetical protein VHI51_10460 [Ktedonobacterales bacterium]|jgi:predicted RNA-binding Zn-ribbon protein involved in translation (DUF1610 family)|nr:hypothetical protein [Ktedonobacterales bacterium]